MLVPNVKSDLIEAMSVAGVLLIVDKRPPLAVRVILELSRLYLLNGAIGNRARSVAGLDRRSTDRLHPTDSVRRAITLGNGDKAISASTTWRIRALLRSMPPTSVLPTHEARGRCSSISSAMKH